MNRTSWTVIGSLVSLLLVGVAFGNGTVVPKKVEDGKAVFTENRCQSCHSIEALGIAKKKPAAGEDEVVEKAAKKPPDLSDVGLKLKAAWFSKFLRKQEKLDGNLHPKKFKGDDADLATLSTWLETLKTKPVKK
ncbi:MAG: c-type cytochrome [Candidatus Eisenbacteria bacterium]